MTQRAFTPRTKALAERYAIKVPPSLGGMFGESLSASPPQGGGLEGHRVQAESWTLNVLRDHALQSHGLVYESRSSFRQRLSLELTALRAKSEKKFTKELRKRMREADRDLEKVYLSIYGILVVLKRAYFLNGAHRFRISRAQSFISLVTGLCRNYYCLGPYAVLKDLKDQSSAVRRMAQTGIPPPGGNILISLLRIFGRVDPPSLEMASMMGRSLPKGNLRVAYESLVSHRAALAVLREVPKVVLDLARTFAKGWAEKTKLKFRTPHSLQTTLSGSYEVPRFDGGANAYLKQVNFKRLVQDVVGRDALRFLPHNPITMLLSEMNSGAQVYLNDLIVDYVLNSVGNNRARVGVVFERGFKTRVVSRHPAVYTIACHFLRGSLFSALKREPCVSMSLQDHRKAVEKVLGGIHIQTDVQVSSDLTTATDLLPRSLQEAIVEGLCDGSDASASHRRLLLSTVGSFVLEYPIIEGYPHLADLVTLSGQLMGLPPSWPLLNVTHLFWVDLAQKLSFHNNSIPRELAPSDLMEMIERERGPQSLSTERISFLRKVSSLRLPPKEYSALTNPAKRSCYCGDDLFARWPSSMSNAYHLLVELCHGLFSLWKHLVHPQSGIFCEEMFRAKAHPLFGPFVTLGVHWSVAFPLRWLSGDGTIDFGLRLPTFFRLTAAGESLVRVDPRRAAPIHQLFLRILRPVFRLSFVLPPYLPRTLGGLGVPHYRGLNLSLKKAGCWTYHRSFLASAVYRGWMRKHDLSFNRIYVTDLLPVFSKLMTAEDQYFSRALKENRIRILRPGKILLEVPTIMQVPSSFWVTTPVNWCDIPGDEEEVDSRYLFTRESLLNLSAKGWKRLGDVEEIKLGIVTRHMAYYLLTDFDRKELKFDFKDFVKRLFSIWVRTRGRPLWTGLPVSKVLKELHRQKEFDRRVVWHTMPHLEFDPWGQISMADALASVSSNLRLLRRGEANLNKS